jgi:hypothetical protein
MAMEILGSNLEELMKELGGKFSLITTLIVADQMVNNLRFCLITTHIAIAEAD